MRGKKDGRKEGNSSALFTGSNVRHAIVHWVRIQSQHKTPRTFFSCLFKSYCRIHKRTACAACVAKNQNALTSAFA